MQHSYKNAVSDEIFDYINKVSDRIQVESFVIGGFVRDFMLQRKSAKDIDIVVVGS